MAKSGKKIIDFGKYGKMTFKEVNEKYGIKPDAIYYKIRKGLEKEQLIEYTRKEKTYNCGRYGWLTADEISKITGLKKGTAYKRATSPEFKLEAIIEGNYYGNVPHTVPDKKVYNCGRYGWLTSSQIAKIANISRGNVLQRININGYKLEEIVEGKVRIIDFGKYGKMSVSEAAEKLNMSRRIISRRISLGYQKEDIIEKSSANLKKYDCGKYGMLTMKEILKISNVNKDSIYNRIRIGYTKEEIVDGRKRIGFHKININRYDCGKYGMLTVKEIAPLAKIHEKSVYKRVDLGFTKEELIDGRGNYHKRLRK